MAIAYDTQNSVPLFYETYPGSIVDVKQIQDMLEKAKGIRIQECGIHSGPWILQQGKYQIP